MLYSFRNIGARHSLGSCVRTWESCFGSWPGRRNARLRKGTGWAIRCICWRRPPKYAVSQVVGYLKGKSAIDIARTYGGKRRNFVGEHFWARGYWVSTVGRDEAAVRYIQQQEKEISASIRWDCSEVKAAWSGSKTNPPWAVHCFKPPALPEVADLPLS